MDTTEHDLRLLSIGYYIQGCVVGFYSLMVLGYAAFIGTIFQEISKVAEAHGRRGIPPELASMIATVVGAVAILSIAYAVCLFLAAHWIRKNRNRVFVYVIAALTCLGIPYGTVLGIFTFMVLQRPVARQLFGRNAPRPQVSPATPGSPS